MQDTHKNGKTCDNDIPFCPKFVSDRYRFAGCPCCGDFRGGQRRCKGVWGRHPKKAAASGDGFVGPCAGTLFQRLFPASRRRKCVPGRMQTCRYSENGKAGCCADRFGFSSFSSELFAGEKCLPGASERTVSIRNSGEKYPIVNFSSYIFFAISYCCFSSSIDIRALAWPVEIILSITIFCTSSHNFSKRMEFVTAVRLFETLSATSSCFRLNSVRRRL